jgi:hypothetical protein
LKTPDDSATVASVPPLRQIILIWAIASLLLCLSLRPYLSHSLTWDEVDYILAAQQGYYANANDLTSFTASDFIRFVQSKYAGQPASLKHNYDETTDVFILRHAHPPLLQYALGLLGESRLKPGYEIAQRMVQFFGASLLIAAMLWGYLKITDRPNLAGLLIVASGGLLVGFFLAHSLNCHLWIAISLPATCVAVGQFITDPSYRRGLIAGGWIGLNYIGLQTGVFVAFWAVIAIGISILIPPAGMNWLREMKWIHKLRFWVRQSLWMLAGFLFVLLVIYPGAIFRLSLLRVFAAYAYLIFKGSEYSDVQSRYLGYLQLSFPMLLLGLAGLVLILLKNRTPRWYIAMATAVIGFGYFISLMKFVLNITYVSPALILMVILGAAAISDLNRTKMNIAIAACLALFTAYTVTSAPFPNQQMSLTDFNKLYKAIGDKPAFIEGGNIVGYYNHSLISQITPITREAGGKSLIRRNIRKLQYETLTDKDLAGSIVVLGTFNGLPPCQWEKNLPPAVEKLDLKDFGGRVYSIPPDFNSNTTNQPSKPDHSSRKPD